MQLSLGYNKECEELKISLLQVKGQSNKEFSDPCEVFINTYLVPDYRYIDSTHYCYNPVAS